MLGIALIPRLPVKLMPSRTMPSLTIYFSMPNTAARVIEAEVTAKIEGMLARIQGLQNINSTSYNDYGQITLEFDKNTNMQKARFEASTIIRQLWPQLPDGVSYPSISAERTMRQSARPILSYNINAPGSTSEIMQYAEDNIRRALGRIDGVNRISLSGATPKEWRLTYDSNQLKTLSLTPSALASAIAEQSASQFLATALTNEGEALAVQSQVNSPDHFDPSLISILTPDSSLIPLSQLVTCAHVDAKPMSYYRINALNSIYCNVYATEEANQLLVAKTVKDALNSLSLPQGYSIQLINDTTEHINSELYKIYFRSGLTLLILLIFVAIVTFNTRYMLIVTISLLISLAISAIFYYLAQIEIQLYSLAGITISINLIIDNIIVTSDHYKRHHNLQVFISVLAATLTTIGALSIVFFLDERLRLNLQDFVAVVIINLSVSLATALWLVPALINQIGLGQRSLHLTHRRLRLIARFNRIYAAYIRKTRPRRWLIIPLLILTFGLPVFMIPRTACSPTYNEKIRPWIDMAFGGTLRLFVEKVANGHYFNHEEPDPILRISASLPNGATLEQMNDLVKKMEAFLLEYPEIRQFQTDIYSPRQAYIAVSFTRQAARSTFPYQLKTEVIRKALTLGGGSWSVGGLKDQGFDNAVHENSGSYKVKLTGYNYDELENFAEQFRHRLLNYMRIKDVTINSEFSWDKNDYTEFYLTLNRDAMAQIGITANQLHAALAPVFGRDIFCDYTNNHTERITLSSLQSNTHDVWSLMNMPFNIGNKTFRLSQFATIEQLNAPPSIVKENQQYILCIQYEYLGSAARGYKLLEDDLADFSPRLPMGYTISQYSYGYSWSDLSASNYRLLLLIAAIIFLITTILFNSLREPLIILLTIPISFIGIFLGFYITQKHFDQGGFAAFVLLCGITVNAAIYLINEYRHNRNYLRAFNAKIIPILLTILSTILGFIPFMVGPDGPEAFWFPLALGTISGLLTSLLAIVLLIPLFLPQKKSAPTTPKYKKNTYLCAQN